MAFTQGSHMKTRLITIACTNH